MAMVDTRRLRDLAASYRSRGDIEGNEALARYNLDMAKYLDSISSIVEAGAAEERAEATLQKPEPQQELRNAAELIPLRI